MRERLRTIMDKQLTEPQNDAEEVVKLRRALTNIQWVLNGDLTDEALRNLRAYVDRQQG